MSRSTEEPETKHISAAALRAKLEELKREATVPGDAPTLLWVVPDSCDLEDVQTRIDARASLLAARMSDDARTATSLDVARALPVPPPRRGGPDSAHPARQRAHAGGTEHVETALVASKEPAGRPAPRAASELSTTRVGVSVRCAELGRLGWRWCSPWRVLLVVGALACIAGALRLALAAGAPRGVEGVQGGRPDRASERVERVLEVRPEVAPKMVAGDRAAAAPALTADVGRGGPALSTGDTVAGATPSTTARTAVDLLASGRNRAALDAYRGLARAQPAQAVYAKIVELLAREQRECEARGDARCGD